MAKDLVIRSREFTPSSDEHRSPTVTRQLAAGFPVAYLLSDGTMIEETPQGERFEITQRENEPRKIVRKL